MRCLVSPLALLLSLLIAAPAAAQSETPESVDPPNVVEARQRVAQGEALFERGDYEGALVELEAAYETIGAHPARYLVLYNIGQCYERLFRYDEAVRYYQRYLDAAPEDEPDRAVVVATVRTLEGMLGSVDVSSNVPGALWIDGHHVGEAPSEVRVPAGQHLVEVRAPGYVDARDEVQVTTGQGVAVSLTLHEETPPYEGIDPTAFTLTTIAAGVVGLVGIGTGIATLMERGRIDATLADDSRRWTITEDDQAWIRSLALTTDLLFGGAALLGVTAVVLALLTDWDGASTATDRVETQLVPTLGGAALVGVLP